MISNNVAFDKCRLLDSFQNSEMSLKWANMAAGLLPKFKYGVEQGHITWPWVSFLESKVALYGPIWYRVSP